MAETTTIYITKGAETHGIRKVEARINHYGDAVVTVERQGFSPSQTYYTPAGFRRTLEEAATDAEARRKKKIASLKKQIAAMEAIDLTKVKEG